MSKRRIYVDIDELTYRGLKRIGVYSGECPGMITRRVLEHLVADRILGDDSFARWMEAEHRDIVYGSIQEHVGPPQLRHPPASPQQR